MDRPELVHVVALIGARASVHKGELAGDEQGGLVVRDGEGTSKDGASLTVLLVAVAEEEGVRSRIAVCQSTRLSDEAARKSRAALYA